MYIKIINYIYIYIYMSQHICEASGPHPDWDGTVTEQTSIH